MCECDSDRHLGVTQHDEDSLWSHIKSFSLLTFFAVLIATASAQMVLYVAS